MGVGRVAATALVGVLTLAGCGAATAEDSARCEFAFVAVTNSFTDTNLLLLDENLTPVRQLTDDGRSYSPDLSPDGRQIAFVNARGYEPSESSYTELSGISVVNVSGEDERQLTRDSRDTSPQWSPDGSRILFLRSREAGERQLLLLDPGTGASTVAYEGNLSGFLWWSDERIAVFRHEGDRTALDLLDLGSGALSPVALPPDVGAGSMMWSPDRTRVAFTRRLEGAYDRDARPTLQVHDLASGEEHTVPGSNTLVNSPILWTSDDNLLFEKNVRGGAIDVAMSGDGGRAPETVLGRVGRDTRARVPQADNPACAP
ncbi:MAG: PD40 domain-containing protein [Geodermatophilaceae bacterium]|nr:PD40 domain-containing protein [Geodermatophilaceae bacterium]